VLGEWGIGKSTLLREYKRLCQRRGVLAAYIPLEPLQPSARLIEAARSIVGGILRDLPYPVDRFKRVLSYFDSVGVTVLGSGIQLSKDTKRDDCTPQAFLHDTLRRLWEDLEDRTHALVILLDELENFSQVPEIMKLLKATLSMPSLYEVPVLFGVATTPSDWEKLAATQRRSPLSRFLHRIGLETLSEGEFRETVTKTFRGAGVSVDDRLVTKMYEYTGGHPYEMQVLGYHIFDNHLSGRRRRTSGKEQCSPRLPISVLPSLTIGTTRQVQLNPRSSRWLHQGRIRSPQRKSKRSSPPPAPGSAKRISPSTCSD
jgi:AAA ATPase-like protein